MTRPQLFSFLPFLCLLFIGTLCSSMIVPFTSYFIVQGLGQAPWTISIYAGAVSILTIAINRQFARRIDGGHNPFPLIGIAACGYLVANISLSLHPSFMVLVTVGVVGFGTSSSALSTMFSLGGSISNRSDIERSKFNAYMRATTSTAWMIGPAVSFFVADQFGDFAVFRLAVAVALLWICLWWWVAPRDAASSPKNGDEQKSPSKGANTVLWLAVSFVFCLSMAHSLTFTALPLFYVQEVGLPGYAPGTAFSVKTFVEVFAIFSTPFLIQRFGVLNSLLTAALLSVVAIQVLASVQSYPQMLFAAAVEGAYYGLFASLSISYVQSFALERPAQATAMYWNTLMVTGVLAGPAAGMIAQAFDFRTVIVTASVVALLSVLVLLVGRHYSTRNGNPIRD